MTAFSVSFRDVGWMLLAWAGGSVFAAACWAVSRNHLKRRVAELEARDRRWSVEAEFRRQLDRGIPAEWCDQ